MEPSTENDMSRATIEPESVRSGLIGSSWRFVAKDDSQRVIAATDVFECNGHALKDGKQARLALEALIDLLRRDGWVGERAPNQTNGTTWYDYNFARKEHRNRLRLYRFCRRRCPRNRCAGRRTS